MRLSVSFPATLILVLLLSWTPVFAQTASYGVKVGVPITQSFLSNNLFRFDNYSFTQPNFAVGPAVDLEFTKSLGFEANALWRRLQYEWGDSTRVNSWELPLMFKAKIPGESVRTFGDVGMTMRYSNGTTDLTNRLQLNPPAELSKVWTRGFVAGGGVELGLGLFRFLPEIRYTRWQSPAFGSPNGLFQSNPNQVDLLLGFKFK